MSTCALEASPTPAMPCTGAAAVTRPVPLRARLAGAFALAALIVFGGAGAVVTALIEGSMQRQLEAGIERDAMVVRDRIDRALHERFSDLKSLAQFEAPRAGGRTPAHFRAALERRQLARPELAWLGYADADGRIVAGTGGRFEGMNAASRPWFKAAQAGPYLGDVRDAALPAKLPGTKDDEMRLVDIALPAPDGNGRPGGVMVAHVDWRWIRDLAVIDRGKGAAGADILVVGADGKVILGPAALLGRPFALDAKSLVREALLTPAGMSERHYVAAASPSRGHGDFRGSGWTVVARQDRSAAHAPVREAKAIIAVAVGGFIALFVLAGFFVARRIARPMETWAEVADRIGLGERELRFPDAGNSAELTRLAVALQSMFMRVCEKEDELQRRVNERTAALVAVTNEVEAERERLAYALDASRLALWDMNAETGELHLSAEWGRMMGGEAVATQTHASALLERVPEDDHDVIATAMFGVLKGQRDAYDVEHRVRRGDGSLIWLRSRGRVVKRAADGRALRMSGTNAEITQRKIVEQLLAQQALTDLLTGLPNKRLLLERLERAMALAHRKRTATGLLFIDLDGFKAVNDSLGHEAGDALLKQVAARFLACVRAADTVARLGGDEFAVLLDGCHTIDDVEVVAAKILHSLRSPFVLAQGVATVSCSVGAVISPRDGTEPDELLRNGDHAMYRAKHAGKNGVARYEALAA